MAADDEGEFDIFKFSKTTKLKSNFDLRGPPRGRVPPPSSSAPDSDQSEESDDGEQDTSQRRRRGSRAGGKKRSMAASLLHHASSRGADTDQVDVASPAKKSKAFTPSPSPSPSPPYLAPSPPPPGASITSGTGEEDKSRKVLNQANDVLNRLWHATPSELPATDYDDVVDLVSFTPSTNINLRVRYKGKIRKYPMNKAEPFSNVITQIAKEVEAVSDKILLSFKTTTIKPTETPGSLGLTTADILDAIVMTESASSLPAEVSAPDSVTIKVQTSDKQKMYSLSATDSLQKVMVAFAAELKTPVENLKFFFDGNLLSNETPLDLEMENDDCIDVVSK